MGNPNGAAALRRAGKGAVALREAVAANADEYAAGLAEVVRSMRAEGHTPLRAMAEQMNERGILTRRGRRSRRPRPRPPTSQSRAEGAEDDI